MVARGQEFVAIKVHKEDLGMKAKELNIFELSAFYESAEFADAQYEFNAEDGTIWRPPIN